MIGNGKMADVLLFKRNHHSLISLQSIQFKLLEKIEIPTALAYYPPQNNYSIVGFKSGAIAIYLYSQMKQFYCLTVCPSNSLIVIKLLCVPVSEGVHRLFVLRKEGSLETYLVRYYLSYNCFQLKSIHTEKENRKCNVIFTECIREECNFNPIGSSEKQQLTMHLYKNQEVMIRHSHSIYFYDASTKKTRGIKTYSKDATITVFILKTI